MPDDTKPWYYSKTMWINIIAFFALVAQAINGEFIVDAEVQAAIIILINFILRMVTGKGLTLTSQ